MPTDSTPATRDAAAAVHALTTAFPARTHGSMALATQAQGVDALYSMDRFQALGGMAERIVASGLYGSLTPPQAFVILQTGMELGLPPTAAMSGIHVIKGKAVMSGQLMITLVHRAGHRFDILESNEKAAHVRLTRTDGAAHEVRYTIEQAQKAGLTGKDNWRNYPRQMCLNRATSECVRYGAPEVLAGIVYTPEDMDATVVGGDIVGVVDTPPPARPVLLPPAGKEDQAEDTTAPFLALAGRIRFVRGEKNAAKAEVEIEKWEAYLDAKTKTIADMETYVSLLEAKKAESDAKAAAKAAVPPPAPAPAPAADPDDPRERAWQDIQATLVSQGKTVFEAEESVAAMKADWSCFHPDDQLDHQLAWLSEQNGGS